MDHLPKLQSMFRDLFDEPGLVLGPETSPATLPAWDSVAQVHLVLALEDAFSIRFTTDEVARIHKVADILAILQART